MEILKPGNKDLAEEKRRATRKFSCDLCGCVWTADREEYEVRASEFNETSAYCKCPCCGEECWTYNDGMKFADILCP